MSTRCQIGFYENNTDNLEDHEVLIYRHFDGYPEGVIPDITPVLKEYSDGRGLHDIEYGSAWLVSKLKTDYTNVGICGRHGFHGDIEYFYAIHTNGDIKVYEVVFDFENKLSNNERFKFLFKYNINDPTVIDNGGNMIYQIKKISIEA